MSGEIHIHGDVHIYYDSPGVLPILQRLERSITMNQAELAVALTGVATALGGVSTQLSKATDEIVVAIGNQGQTTPEVDAAVASLQAVTTALATASKALDDLNADATPAG